MSEAICGVGPACRFAHAGYDLSLRRRLLCDRRFVPAQRDAQHAGELGAAVGFCQEQDALLELAFLVDGVIGIARCEEDAETGAALPRLGGEVAPGATPLLPGVALVYADRASIPLFSSR
ncbi:hypothetical protein ABIF38_003877 [Bradyrhizobium japonicum]|uniref:hypothetical protein n=1 Tax=Bradyrhizobium TaxID=374 RepID=UPI000372DC3F|nr:hypothetical protein [Bradyrhizobium elkanii]MCP1733805.1 hypothetical protein [Bradyrhizobium elkanii]MCS3569142.1 hypothetical protein [Bradyrhizobium elkanii]MCS3589374.1 hypothetical protein [Bradyrhizobium elkanii]MCS3618816.1 hypothetical protein [Bradyrhizobium elkanii]MCS3694367.1 hypothetical protein [Bradyrhizobium elkanii]